MNAKKPTIVVNHQQMRYMFYFKQHRLASGLNVPQISQLTGIPVRTIEALEKRGDCLFSNAVKIASALKISVADLLVPVKK